MQPRLVITLLATVLLLATSWPSNTVHSDPPTVQAKAEATRRYKSPLGLAVDREGKRAYVALYTAGAVAVVDLRDGKVLREIAVGDEPVNVVDYGGSVQVYCQATDEVVEIDTEIMAVRRRTPLAKVVGDTHEPLSRDKYAYVPLKSGLNPSPAGASNIRGWSNAGPGGMADIVTYVAHQRPKTNVPATQVAQGWVFTNALTRQQHINTTLILDEPQRGFADPTDVLIAANGKVFVASAGADAVLVLDSDRIWTYVRKHNNWSYGQKDESGNSDDLTASRHYVVARLPTQANPRRMALSGDGKTLVVSNYLGDSVTVIDAVANKVLRHIPLGGPEPDAVRRGEILFNSGKMTFQGQFSCASCHPNGGSDGLNWDLERDGLGNFKNTKSLLGVKDTAPYGWLGTSPTLADRIRGTLRTLHRHEPGGSEVEDLVAYLESLPFPKPPQSSTGLGLGAPEKRGQAIFEGKGLCTKCHRRAALDDDRSHDVGTRGPGDTQDRFDTPSLRGIARTAPYLHDGRSATLKDVFTTHNKSKRHGAAHTLDREELKDLVAYLKSL